MEARDLVRLRTPLIVLFLCLLLALAAGWHAYVQEESATAQARSANASFREARNRYEAARRDEALMRLTIKRFRVLEAQHMIGAEERLGWIERLRAARESTGLAQLSYELRPRQPILRPDEHGRYKLTSSRMLINADALHGQSLVDFLDRLALESSALMMIRSCDIKRHDDAGMVDAKAALDVRCELDWVTVADNPTGEASR